MNGVASSPYMNAVAGVSGGRTSALMALRYVPKETILCFQNTGCEHSKTYDFLKQLEDDLGRPLIRLEWRSPPRGEAPRFGSFEVVSHDCLARRGQPFRDFLTCLATFRKKQKNKPPVAPWARQRICTAYLKIKTQRAYALSLGWEDWTSFVGLRYDEPERIALMKKRCDERDVDERAPLHEEKITKTDVLRYWASKKYDLDIPEHLGNCVGCFLKDEADLARALVDGEGNADWWIAIEEDFAPMRRGRASYRQVHDEAPARLRIAKALREGRNPKQELPERRHLAILKQEERRAREGVLSFSCSCESASQFTDDFLLESL